MTSPRDVHTPEGNLVVVDGHCDTLWDVYEGKRRLGERSREGHVDLPRLREGGVSGQVFAVYVGGASAVRPLVQFLRLADALYRAIDDHPDDLVLARTAGEVEQAAAGGRVAAILGMEGAEPLEGDLAVLRVAHRLGVRNLGLVWGGRNALGSAVSGEGCDDEGLSDFGIEVVRACNERGVIVDVSHLNIAGFWDVVKHSEKPFIASHSNARAVYDHVRNLYDDQILALAERGGVAQVVFTFLGPDRTAYRLEDVLDMVDYMVGLAGAEHVGVGSDFDGIRYTPRGLEDVSKMGNLVRGLRARGHGADDIGKIMGGNFLRVLREVAGA
jgi:membrane dipeptidase